MFVDDEKTFAVLVNFDDHIKIVCINEKGDVAAAITKMQKLLYVFEKLGYASDTHLGYLTTCPSNLGTAMNVKAVLELGESPSQEQLDEMEYAYQCVVKSAGAAKYSVGFKTTLAANLSEADAVSLFCDCLDRLAQFRRYDGKLPEEINQQKRPESPPKDS